MKVTVSLTKREADEILRCDIRQMYEGGYALRQTVAQKTAMFKLRAAVLDSLSSPRQELAKETE